MKFNPPKSLNIAAVTAIVLGVIIAIASDFDGHELVGAAIILAASQLTIEWD